MSTQGRYRARSSRAWRVLVRLVSTALFLGVLGLATALIVVPKLTGAVPLTVLTGSMSPTYAPGSVVVTRPTSVEQLQIGDAITFQERSGDPTVVTHRIVGIGVDADGHRHFTTQGDANGAPDPTPVTTPQVRGKVWYSVPYVGHALASVDASTRVLLLDIAAAGLVLYGLFLVTAGLRDARRRRGVPGT